MMIPTESEIEAAKTERGGWTKSTLAKWGVPWPPPKGWKNRLVNEARMRKGVDMITKTGRDSVAFDAGDAIGRERTQIAVLRALLESERQVRSEKQDTGLIERLEGTIEYLTTPRE